MNPKQLRMFEVQRLQEEFVTLHRQGNARFSFHEGEWRVTYHESDQPRFGYRQANYIAYSRAWDLLGKMNALGAELDESFED